MSLTKIGLGVAFVSGVVLGAGGSSLIGADTGSTVPQPEVGAIARACPEIRNAEGGCVDLHRCATHLGNDSSESEGWCCGGAFMGPREQACIDEAQDRATAAPIAEVAEGE